MSEHQSLHMLESQIRECFGRVIYTHKTHSKMADACSATLRWLKILQIVLSALTATGAIGILFTDDYRAKLVTAVISLLTVGINAYMKGFDPGATAQKHRDAAADMWPIRESYLSLLSDIAAGDITPAAVRERRDDLQDRLAAIYRGAPHTRVVRLSGTGKCRKGEYFFSKVPFGIRLA